MRSNTTFSITFFVKKHRVFHGKVPIYARVTVDGKRTDLSIKRKIDLDRWDEVKGSARSNKQETKVLNSYLEQVGFPHFSGSSAVYVLLGTEENPLAQQVKQNLSHEVVVGEDKQVRESLFLYSL